MSGDTRPLRADEVGRVLPALRAARVFDTAEDLAAFRLAGPWRVRVSDLGDVLVVARWRSHLPTLAIRALLAPPSRVEALASDASAVARSQGLACVLSPLLVESAVAEWVAAGFTPVARLTAFTALTGTLTPRGFGGFSPKRYPDPAPARLRPATSEDVGHIAALDACCFENLWRLTEPDIDAELAVARVIVAESDGGSIVGYTAAVTRGSHVLLARLAVVKEARRRGIARVLIADVHAWAQQVGAHVVSLATQETNEPSRALYRAMGFRELPEPYLMLERVLNQTDCEISSKHSS